MKIKELSSPVTSSKADWLPIQAWMGFSPANNHPASRQKRQAAVIRQVANGYVLEYMTKGLEQPNSPYRESDGFAREKLEHEARAGQLIAVHRLKPSSMPLQDILGREDYEELQNRWASGVRRYRWSVAFPVVESFDIVEPPLADRVFSGESYRRLYGVQSSVLRLLRDEDRLAIADLEIAPRATRNAWIGIESEFVAAERSYIPEEVLDLISLDLTEEALEGFEFERRVKLRKRAAWLAMKIATHRASIGQMHCDHCGLDPLSLIGGRPVRPRSLLDVHHKSPLDEGRRYTTFQDFSLLCPTCHRFEHMVLKEGESLLGSMSRA